MSAALVLVAAALLAWPGVAAERRRRLRRLTRRPSSAGPRTPAVSLSALPPSAWPLPAAALAGLGGAVVGTLLVGVLAAAAAAAAARSLARARARHRDEVRLDGLADALGAVAAELRGGRPLEAATASALAGCPDDDLAQGLARALRAPAAASATPGTDLGVALGRVAAAVLLSGRTGCSLAAVVGAVEDDLRARRRQRQELRSVTAGPRASAALLAGLPLLALAMGSGIGADPWAVLTTTAAGQVLLVAGVCLEAAGLAWSARLVRRAVGSAAA